MLPLTFSLHKIEHKKTLYLSQGIWVNIQHHEISKNIIFDFQKISGLHIIE